MEKVKILVCKTYVDCWAATNVLGSCQYTEITQGNLLATLNNLSLNWYDDHKNRVLTELERELSSYHEGFYLNVVDGYKNGLGELLIKSSDAQHG